MDFLKKHKTIVIIAVLAIIAMWGISAYNGLVSMDEGVQTKWADVETQYQRRADLIPNLVNTVKGYAAHESETLTAVVEARAKATSVIIDPTNMTTEQIANFQKAQDGVTSALGRLLVTVEKYPELKANENFRELQAQLEGTENRISVARRDFNEAARKYNTTLRSFPKNILANMFGFEKKSYFEAQEGSEQAPTVQF